MKKDFIGKTLTIGPNLMHYGVKGMKWRVKKAAGSNEDVAGGPQSSKIKLKWG